MYGRELFPPYSSLKSSSSDEFEDEPSTFAHIQRKISGRRPKPQIERSCRDRSQPPSSPNFLLNPNHNLMEVDDDSEHPASALRNDRYRSSSIFKWSRIKFLAMRKPISVLVFL